MTTNKQLQEPVAWLVRERTFCGDVTTNKDSADFCEQLTPGSTTPLYTRPSPSASALVEALEQGFPLLSDEGLDEVEHHCEWVIQRERVLMNNCDGCQSGMEIVDGIHRHNGRPFMVCQRSKYEPPAEKKTGKGAGQ